MRDLDVQLENLAAMSFSDADLGLDFDHHGRDPLAELAALLEREREAPRADMLQGLDSVALGSPGQGADRHGAAGTGAPLPRHPGARPPSACPNWC